MTKESFERDWNVKVEDLHFKQAISDQYGVKIPNTEVAKVGPFEVWKENGSTYRVSRNHVVCRWRTNLSVYLKEKEVYA